MDDSLSRLFYLSKDILNLAEFNHRMKNYHIVLYYFVIKLIE